MGWDGGIGWRREGGVEGVKTRAVVGQYRLLISTHYYCMFTSCNNLSAEIYRIKLTRNVKGGLSNYFFHRT